MPDKLIILTDLGSFKVYKLTKDELSGNPHVSFLEEFDPVESHMKLSDRVSDQAGRFPVGNGVMGTGAMSHGENHNLRLETQRRVLKFLAESINNVVKREDPRFWYFAANSEVDQKILEMVEPGVKSRLQKHVRSDLTKVDKSKLLSYFA